MWIATILVVLAHSLVLRCLSLLASLIHSDAVLPLVITYLTCAVVAAIHAKHVLLACLLYDRDTFLAELDKNLDKEDLK